MKKIFLALTVFLFTSLILVANAQIQFYEAIKNCQEYKKDGSITRQAETFNILITLNKAKGDKCIYKEKIYQNKEYQMLTCEFKQHHQDFISDSMKNFNNKYKNEISKNSIFEAKLTTNVEVFQKYLVDPAICNITYSKK